MPERYACFSKSHSSEIRCMKMENSIVGVVGAGAMGSGIAQVAAQAGHQVI
ncbi:MAG: 3-hydroxyacyl-CoA dehydrogenase NAD-binding domain-containing protein, partial [Flavobacteriales bacterium]